MRYITAYYEEEVWEENPLSSSNLKLKRYLDLR